MSTHQTWLLGTLANHPRGKVIAEAVPSSHAHVLPPDFGVCIAFGSEFQERDKDSQREWAAWSESAERTLLLIPPFKVEECTVPVKWRIQRPQSKVTDAGRLAKLLAAEVRYEVAGGLQVANDVGGQWKSGGINTAYYRKHPHAGLFVVTCLPLWSLSVLDHRDELRKWLMSLHELSGQRVEADEAQRTGQSFRPAKDHYAMMLHLCTKQFKDLEAAITALAESPVLALPDAAARQCLEQLQAAGLSDGGQLTDAGRDMLFDSPYAAYAEAMTGGAQ